MVFYGLLWVSAVAVQEDPAAQGLVHPPWKSHVDVALREVV